MEFVVEPRKKAHWSIFADALLNGVAGSGERPRFLGPAVRLQPDRGGPCEPDAKSLAVGADHFGH